MRSSLILLLIGAALAIFGVLWSTCALVSGSAFPVEGYSAWNLAAGIALAVTGGAMVLRGRSIQVRKP